MPTQARRPAPLLRLVRVRANPADPNPWSVVVGTGAPWHTHNHLLEEVVAHAGPGAFAGRGTGTLLTFPQIRSNEIPRAPALTQHQAVSRRSARFWVLRCAGKSYLLVEVLGSFGLRHNGKHRRPGRVFRADVGDIIDFCPVTGPRCYEYSVEVVGEPLRRA